MHLLHRITRSLDLTCQRNLFLTCSQLYSRWNLHVPEHSRHWQLVKTCVKVLTERTLDNSCCATSNVSVHFEQQVPWTKILCQRHPQGYKFSLVQSANKHPRARDTKTCSDLTEAQLWHRLAASPKLAFASLFITSDAHATPLQLKAFTKHCFDLLCTKKGIMTIYMAGMEESHEEMDIPGQHAIKIHHSGDHWDIDGELCIKRPPTLDFDNFPDQVVQVHAQFLSQGPRAQEYVPFRDPECWFFPDNQAIHDFAYRGNVDIEAWVEEQHEAANDWYDHMDDFMQDDEDLDDMDDLDDAAMAQLLGAMQG